MPELLQRASAWFESPYVQAASVVLLAVVVAKFVEVVVSSLVRRLSQRTKTDVDDHMLEVLQRPVFLSVILVGLYVAFNLLPLVPRVRFIGVGVLKTLSILLWTGAGFNLASLFLTVLSRLADRVTWLEQRTLPLFDNLAKLLILGVASYFLLLSWDINISAWLASASVIGLVLGFAAKDTIANLFGGVFIMADAPYKLGDFIVLDSGERGRVRQIGLRSTRILTRDDVEITIPNAIIANAKITNESGGPWEKQRIRTTVGVAYGSDIDRVHAVLQEAALGAEHVSKTPQPRVRFREFGDSALTFQVMCWIEQPALHGSALDALNTSIYKKLNENHIEIPFPQRDVHVLPR